MKSTLISIIIFATIFAACNKKDNATPPEETVIQKLQHKWNINSYTINQHVNGHDDIKTKAGSAGDYIDFRPDGKAYTLFENETDTVEYFLENDQLLKIVDVGSFSIETITLSKLFLHFKFLGGGGDFYEEKLDLSR